MIYDDEYIPEVDDSIVVTLDGGGIHRQTRCKRKPTRIVDDFEKDCPIDEPPGWADP